jgi:hypothetical protein
MIPNVIRLTQFRTLLRRLLFLFCASITTCSSFAQTSAKSIFILSDYKQKLCWG